MKRARDSKAGSSFPAQKRGLEVVTAASSELEILSVTRLKPNPRNARIHTNKQVRQIAASIRRFGFTAPILIDEDGNVLSGHGRLLAAQFLKMKTVPCRRICG